jgi:cysteine synthase
MVAAAAGCRCAITLPDDAAAEKAQLLACLGAAVRPVRPVSIAHPDHFVNVARRVRTMPNTVAGHRKLLLCTRLRHSARHCSAHC